MTTPIEELKKKFVKEFGKETEMITSEGMVRVSMMFDSWANRIVVIPKKDLEDNIKQLSELGKAIREDLAHDLLDEGVDSKGLEDRLDEVLILENEVGLLEGLLDGRWFKQTKEKKETKDR